MKKAQNLFNEIQTEQSRIKRKREAKISIIPFKKSPKELEQSTLFPANIFDNLPEEHLCKIYSEILEQLDASSLHKNYSVLGQNAFDPKLLTGILIYAYSQGVFSSRKIEERLKLDLGFMYIGKMQKPNHRVLSDFRKNNLEYFKKCFKQSVMLAMEVGLVSLGHISLDGSKFKANTSKHKAMSYGRLKTKESELEIEIEQLTLLAEKCDEEENKKYKEQSGYEIPEDLKYKKARLAKIKKAKEALEKREEEKSSGKEIEDQKQISFADKDASPINDKKGEFGYKYNGQISVDSANQIIVGQHLTQNANDKEEVEPAITELKETLGTLPEKMSLDNGYMSGKNLESIAKNELDAYVATGRGEKDNITENDKLSKEIFIYDEETDCFLCPTGKKIELKSINSDGKKTYKAKKEDCNNCPLQDKCCSSKKGEPRSISSDCYELLRNLMKDKMQLDESKEIYKKRKTIVEPVFGQIKNSGFREFSLRGLNKVKDEFSLVCAVHNIKKIVMAIKNGLVRLIPDKMALNLQNMA